MLLRQIGRLAATLLLVALLAPAARADDGLTLEERLLAVSHSSEAPSTIMVVHVEHRKAEELAEVLRRVVPPDVRVVADPATNSLIIAAPGAAAAHPVAPEGGSDTDRHPDLDESAGSGCRGPV